jgi:SAM-dependent methyltransferase
MGMVVGVGSCADDCACDTMIGDPTRWLVEHAEILPSAGDALDVASGSGRNAVWLAQRGFETLAVDRDATAIASIRQKALRAGLPLHAEIVDLEARTVSLGRAAYDVIVVVHYLHRPLFAALKAALRHDGVLVYETFTRAQAARGKPTNPAFLLEPGELRELTAPLEVLFEREGEFEGKMLASVIAKRV